MDITPLIGYSYGAKNKEHSKNAMKQTTIAIVLIRGIFSSFVLFTYLEKMFSLGLL